MPKARAVICTLDYIEKCFVMFIYPDDTHARVCVCVLACSCTFSWNLHGHLWQGGQSSGASGQRGAQRHPGPPKNHPDGRLRADPRRTRQTLRRPRASPSGSGGVWNWIWDVNLCCFSKYVGRKDILWSCDTWAPQCHLVADNLLQFALAFIVGQSYNNKVLWLRLINVVWMIIFANFLQSSNYICVLLCHIYLSLVTHRVVLKI